MAIERNVIRRLTHEKRLVVVVGRETVAHAVLVKETSRIEERTFTYIPIRNRCPSSVTNESVNVRTDSIVALRKFASHDSAVLTDPHVLSVGFLRAQSSRTFLLLPFIHNLSVLPSRLSLFLLFSF